MVIWDAFETKVAPAGFTMTGRAGTAVSRVHEKDTPDELLFAASV
jgi:hypothetical protein